MTSAAAASPRRAPGMSASGRSWIERFWYYLPAIIVFAGTIGAWELIVSNSDLRGLPLPAPSAILNALAENW